MGSECFCGCGRRIPRFPLGMRSINTRGRQVAERLEWAEEHGGRLREDLTPWFEYGEAIVATLASAMHGEIDPRALDERPVREWQREGRELLRNHRAGVAELGRASRASGLTPDEAAQALVTAMSDGGMTAEEAIEALGRGELHP